MNASDSEDETKKIIHLPETHLINIYAIPLGVPPHSIFTITRNWGKIAPPPHPGFLGNPYRLQEWDRVEAIRLFETYFLDRVVMDAPFYEAVMKLKGKYLGCVCPPEMCHGDVIKKWLDEQEVEGEGDKK